MIFTAFCLGILILIVYTLYLLEKSQDKWDKMLLEDEELDILHRYNR